MRYLKSALRVLSLTTFSFSVLFTLVYAEQSIHLRYQQMDLNHDSKITRDEWRGDDRSFMNHDWNGDGFLSHNEVKTWDYREDASLYPAGPQDNREGGWRKTAQRHFTTFDSNRDGAVSRGEWQGAGETFDRLDGNRDGILSQPEFFSRPEVWAPAPVSSQSDSSSSMSSASGTSDSSALEQLLLQLFSSNQ